MGNAPTTGGDDVYTDAHGGLVSYHFVGATGWPAAGPSSWPVGGGGDSRTTALTPFPATSSAPTAVAGVQSATITSTRATIGEAPTRYVVTASPGDATCTADVSGVCTITGLTAGTAYTFTSVAHNADPTPSGRSTASPSVTPTAPPVVPSDPASPVTPVTLASSSSSKFRILATAVSAGGLITVRVHTPARDA